MGIPIKPIIILDKNFTPTLATKKVSSGFTPYIKNPVNLPSKPFLSIDKNFTPTLATKKATPEFTPTIKNNFDLSYSYMQRVARYFSDSRFILR